MVKLSDVKTKTENVDEPTTELMNYFFPDKTSLEDDTSRIQYPSFYFALIIAIVFFLLSLPYTDKLIYRFLPTLEKKKSFVILIKASVLFIVVFLINKFGFFK